MPFTRIRSLRLRLVAIIVAMLLPMAIITAVNALVTFWTVERTVANLSVANAENVAQQVGTAFRSAWRVALTASGAVNVSPGEGAACKSVVEEILSVNLGHAGLRVGRPGGFECSALSPDLPADQRADALAALSLDPVGPPVVDFLRVLGGEAWLTPVKLGARPTVLIRGAAPTRSGRVNFAVLIQATLLETVLGRVTTAEGGNVALVNGRGEVVASPSRGTDWISSQPIRRTNEAVQMTGRDGESRIYARAAVAGEDLAILAASDAGASRAAGLQLAMAVGLPLLTLVLILMAYARAIQSSVLDWIYALEGVARGTFRHTELRAPVSDRMPVELRNVAVSFNDMLDRRQARESAISSALAHNHFLAKELHHRVKNSLQVVQSFIGLSKRDRTGQARAVLAGAECRVYVLSAAYRLSLSEGEMRPAPAEDFLTDICDMAASLLRHEGQTVKSHFASERLVNIDQAIPLGLVVVDLLETLLSTGEPAHVLVAARDSGPNDLLLEVHCEPPRRIDPGSRLLSGLVGQLQAEIVTSAGQGPVFVAKIPLPQH